MKKSRFTLIFVLFVIILSISGCVTYTPQYDSTEKIENEVEVYSNPYYLKERTTYGKFYRWATVLGGTGAGAYAGYYLVPLETTSVLYENSGISANNQKIINASILGLTGMISGMLLNNLTDAIMNPSNKKLGSIRYIYGEKGTLDWLNDINNDLLLIEYKESWNNTVNKISAVNEDAKKILSERDFKIKNIFDAKTFRKIYPKSKLSGIVVKNSLIYFNDFTIPELIPLFQNDKIVRQTVIDELIARAGNLNQLKYLSNNYPEMNNRIDSLALDMCKNINDISTYIDLFSTGNLKKSVEIKAFDYANTYDEIELFKKLFPDSKLFNDLRLKSLKNIKNIDDVLQFMNSFPYEEFRTILEEKAANYVKSMGNINTFVKLFPNSDNNILAVKSILPYINRNDIIELNDLFKNNKNINILLGSKYFELSSNTEEFIEVAKLFPELYQQSLEKAKDYCSNVKDYRRFLAFFGNSELAEDIRQKYNEEICQKAENLGTNVNSEFGDYSPIISPDGETLFFVRNNGQNCDIGDEDIYYSKIDSLNEWGYAKNIGYPLNNENPNAVVSVTPDGNVLLLHNSYQGTNTGLSMSYRTVDGWSEPIDLEIDGFYSLGTYHNEMMSNTGRVIMLSINRYDTYGGNDIYVIFKRTDNSWTAPKNIGSVINTETEESGPFLASDNKTLYFSSGGHGGFGQNDIFLSRRLDETWINWSEPENLGQKINTSENECFYNIPASGDYAYFSTDYQSYGCTDLYRIGLPLDKRPNPVILIEGKVINEKTNEPLLADIYYEDLITGEEIGSARTDPNTGIYKIVLPSGYIYGFRAESEGFIPINQNMDLKELKVFQKNKCDLQLVPIEVNQKLPINNLFFEYGKSNLKAESFPELNRIAKILINNPTLEMEVSGHTCDIGSESYNLQLSKSRAEAVAKYLANKGIKRGRLKSIGYGDTLPVVPNDCEENRQKNRRVEIKIISI